MIGEVELLAICCVQGSNFTGSHLKKEKADCFFKKIVFMFFYMISDKVNGSSPSVTHTASFLKLIWIFHKKNLDFHLPSKVIIGGIYTIVAVPS